MVNLGLVVLAVCLTVAVNLSPASARPQFSFLGGIGVQTPVGGVHLGVPTGLTINVGRQPAAPLKSPPIATNPDPQQPVPIVESNASGTENLGTRLAEASESTPVAETPMRVEETGDLSPPGEENPCQNVDPSSATTSEMDGDAEEGITTALPCLGIGAGNRINPKQAVLLSLVG
uniref:DUF4794 domain-containing protein n=1 Tax=Anopheles epiroticus TaxID=199890 RepID=A0A182PY75_9DIPT